MSLPPIVYERDEEATRAIAEFGANDERALRARFHAIDARWDCCAFESALSLADALFADCSRVLGRFVKLTNQVAAWKFSSLRDFGDKARAHEWAEENMLTWKAEKGDKFERTLWWQYHRAESTIEDELAKERLIECLMLLNSILGKKDPLTRTSAILCRRLCVDRRSVFARSPFSSFSCSSCSRRSVETFERNG